MKSFRLSVSALVIGCCATQLASAQCLVDDASFATEDGGCKDLNTGLVWSPDYRSLAPPGATGGLGGSGPDCDIFNFANHGGFSDWRLNTVGEVEEALANGLNSHLGFFLDGSSDDGVYRWTSCRKKVRGEWKRYNIRFSDGDVRLSNTGPSPHDVWLVCVRGLPEPSDCFGPAGGDPDGKGGGKGGGRGKNKNAMLLPRATTGALLMLPLCMVVSVCLVKRRWA